jgi:hypothetical protein
MLVKPNRTEVTRRTLEAIPERTLKFLRTVSAEPAIQRALEKHGYSAAEHQRGWQLLHEAAGFRGELPPEDTYDDEVRAAVAELEAVEIPVFRIAKASLAHRYPRQAEFLFHGMGAARGRASVLRLEILLDRLDALELGIDRDDTRAEDRAAVQMIEDRTLSTSERARLRALIEIAKRSKPVSDVIDRKAEQQKQTERLAALRLWLLEWTQIARAVITRGDYLIRLGLATQRVKRHREIAERSAADLNENS